MTLRAAAEQALALLTAHADTPTDGDYVSVADALRAALAAEQPQPDYPCRSDGRCQYAIDSGAEGMGHCPRGKCVMPAEQPQSEAEFDGLEWARKFAEFDPPAPAEQLQPVAPSGWRMVPVEPTAKMLDAACELDAREAALAEMVAEYKRAGLTYSSGVVPMGRELTVQYRAMLAAAPTPQPEAVAWPKVNGTARMFDNARALMVIMEREPTDDEMRAFDDAIKGWAAPPPAAPQPEAQPVATLHDDGYWTWKRDDFRRQYETQRAGWRMDVFSAPPPAAPGPSEAELPPLPIGEAEVVWHEPDPVMPERPGKIIDASIAFFDAAPLGTHLYTAEQMRDYALRAAAAARGR